MSDSYLDTYFSRVNHLGNTTAERIRSAGIRSFYKWMAESPHTVRDLSVERGIYFDGIILTSKDKEYEKIMFLNVANNIPLKVGDIMTWDLEDGSQEKWIIAQEEKKVNGTYRTFWIIRCNYLLKWIDQNGHLQQSWAYVVSSVDSKIKGNYRTWHNLITPQPNKYAEILMPYFPLDRATNFIVQDESWHTIESDFTSVPGTIYVSLTENKVNYIYDDLENDIADTDKRAVYTIAVPAEVQRFTSDNQDIKLSYTVMKNGLPFKLGENESVTYESSDKHVVKVENGLLVAVGEGEANIRVILPNMPDSENAADELFVPIIIDNAEQPHSGYIDGPDKIRLGQQAVYTVKEINGNNVVINFSLIQSKPYATLIADSLSCTVQANAKNLLGEVTLIADCIEPQLHLEKLIKIIPLW